MSVETFFIVFGIIIATFMAICCILFLLYAIICKVIFKPNLSPTNTLSDIPENDIGKCEERIIYEPPVYIE